MGYYLYHDKEKKIIEIGKIKENSAHRYMADLIKEGEIESYNRNYFVSDDRKLLKDKANHIRAEWFMAAENELKLINAIQIKNKY